MGAPHEVPGADSAGIDHPVAEAQFVAGDFENAPAFFRFLRTAPGGGVEDHAVAGLERRDPVGLRGLDDDAPVGDPEHLRQKHAAMARRASANHRLVVRAGQEERAEAARVDLFELEFAGRRDARAERPAQASSTALR